VEAPPDDQAAAGRRLILSAGARAIVTGGFQSLPKWRCPGALLIGDTAGLLNVPKIKGTHQALRSGMLAAEHLAGELQAGGLGREAARFGGDGRTAPRAQHQARLQEGPVVRHVQRRLGNDHGRPLAVDAGVKPDWCPSSWTRCRPGLAGKRDWVSRDLPPRDRLAGVYFAATEHDEDQPVHLKVADPDICINPLRRGVRQPLHPLLSGRRLRDGRGPDGPAGTGKRLQINAANCVHCKTCDIKDPYQIINWVTPEGGAGPNYQNL
jgi:electron-transferring-flavoprotein dehydrogenase